MEHLEFNRRRLWQTTLATRQVFHLVLLSLATICLLGIGPLARTSAGESVSVSEGQANRLQNVFVEAIENGLVVGAQLATGTSNSEHTTHSLGGIAPMSRYNVNRDTLFCVGSCSKPMAATCILRLADNGRLSLDIPIDRWVPSFAVLRIQDGRAADRAPTLRELLAHRAGIYSQTRGPMTVPQRTAIRDFRLTLGQSVRIIERQPLISAPGESFAYSGAGFCVAGYVAERATGLPFEAILQHELARPLGLTRTTYFPSPRDNNVAVPGFRLASGQIVWDRNAPHLLKSQLRFSLVGGSIYSTATETAIYCQMVLNRGRRGTQPVLSTQAWDEFSKRQFDDQSYGLGWQLIFDDGKLSQLAHSGALAGYRSQVVVDIRNDRFAVCHWTLSSPADTRATDLTRRVQQVALGAGPD